MAEKTSSLGLSQEDLQEYKMQLEKGSIQKAYRAILSFMLGLRTRFVSIYGDASVSALYQGYMDMTYFAVFPQHPSSVAI